MDVHRLLGTVIRGALTGRRKRRRGALRFLTGGKGSLLDASTLVTAAGIAWGLYETASGSTTASPGRPAGPPRNPQAGGPAVPPPIPSTPSGAVAAMPADVLRLVRLAVSAASVDGAVAEAERREILAQAREVGAEAAVQDELDHPRPLSTIVAGVTEAAQKADLYRLAFALVRADEQVSGAERIYLAQLAHQLGLEAGETARLEQDAAARIDAAAAE